MKTQDYKLNEIQKERLKDNIDEFYKLVMSTIWDAYSHNCPLLVKIRKDNIKEIHKFIINKVFRKDKIN